MQVRKLQVRLVKFANKLQMQFVVAVGEEVGWVSCPTGLGEESPAGLG